MANDKVTITLDLTKSEAARALFGGVSTSQVIDLALERLIRAERLRRDVEAYRRDPPTGDEFAPIRHTGLSDIADDTDWEALYAEKHP